MAVTTVSGLINDTRLNSHPILIDDGHSTSITVTGVRRTGADGASYVVTGVIFRDGGEWVPHQGFWPVIVTQGPEATFDAMGAVLEKLTGLI